MNSIKVVEAAEIAHSLGLPSDNEGLPSRASVARAIRTFIRVNRFACRDELESWFHALASAAGYAGEPVKKRFHSVCSQLVAAGDCAAANKDDRKFLISVDPKTIDLGFEQGAILGDAPDSDAAGSGDGVIRKVGRQPEAVSLLDHLSPPPWPPIAESLGLPSETSPSRFLSSLRMSASERKRQHQLDLEILRSVSMNKAGARLCVARDGDDEVPLICLPNEPGEEYSVRLDSKEHLGWLYLGETGVDATRDWPADLPIPSSALAALTFLGEPQNDHLTRWELSDIARETLAQWLGVPIGERPVTAGDAAQSRVIDSPSSARLLVAAGPGSGKTWTACMRVSKLIESGTAPSRILIVSFTRAAVAEIRARIASFLGNPRDAYQLNIQTLDSLAWSLNVGAGGGGQSSGDFDRSISAALKLFANPEDWLLDEIERYQHVVIDEAQDLAGDRRSLVMALLRNLAEGCGASVFHDPAQAIYGFLDAGPQGVEEELASWEPPFDRIALDRNYRCKSPSLEAIFADGRSMLRNPDLDARDVYNRIRRGIEETASSANTRQPGGERRSTFHLYRWRGQLNTAIDRALRGGVPFRTRLPHHRTFVQPWVAATLHRFRGKTISEGEFADLHNDLRPQLGVTAEQAWQSLRRICGAPGEEIDLVRLAELMQSGSPVPELAISDVGPRSAPLYSTIHAAKGREAETVVLSLPYEPANKTDGEILEEARVLYVAATRASSELRLAPSPRGMKTLDRPSRRTWRAWGHGGSAAKVELGCPGDVKPNMQLAGSTQKDDANFALWQAAQLTKSLVLNFADGRYRIAIDDGGIEVGTLSRAFNEDLRSIGRELTRENVYPARRIEGGFMLGSTSVATIDEGGRPSFTLVPILSGTPIVFFNRS